MGHVRAQKPQNALPDGRARCARCTGRGTVESRRAWRTMITRCPECKGTGASAQGAL
jgi:DnaJ-class molecular chaperone